MNPLENEVWGCQYCNGKIDYVNTHYCKVHGVGHEQGCPHHEDEVNEDWQIWSDYHLGRDFPIDAPFPANCKGCGISLQKRCECHRTLIRK